MNKYLLTLWALLASLTGAYAQAYNIKVDESIPAGAAPVLVQRFTQMLGSGGLAVAEEGTPLTLSAQVTDRMETPGSLSQVALVVDLRAVCGEVAETFTLKGVGNDENDAWQRAVKQLLPRSKQALKFVEKLKE